MHDGLVYGAGASYTLPPAWKFRRWKAIADLTGSVPRGYGRRTARYNAPLSARAGLRAWFSPNWSFEAGAGAGIGETGYGHEGWRVFAGIRWGREPLPPDEDWDKDGVPNAKDQCPRDAGPAELDGCPDVDLDLIPDREDRCPREPGPAENEGCPVSVDEPVVEIESERLTLKDSIQFDTGKDTIKRPSFKILDQVVKLMLESPRAEEDPGRGAHRQHRRRRVQQGPLGAARRLGGALPRREGRPAAPASRRPGTGSSAPSRRTGRRSAAAKNRRVEFRILHAVGFATWPGSRCSISTGRSSTRSTTCTRP